MTPAGLYVHVPFCLTRCGYCDFNAYAGMDHLAGRYVLALGAEAALAAATWEGVPFASVFVGGGTPTTLPPDALGDLLDGFRRHYALSPSAEITVESNPDTVDAAYLRRLRERGVNRVSFGLQSFDPAVLAALERIHTAEAAIAAHHAAREAGFDDVNLDLIYGAHGETLGSWRRTLERTIALGPDHVSAYALTIEPNTMLGRRVATGEVPAPDPDLQATMYDAACDLLGGAGYEHYEVSNWARPGHACVHNLGYWEGRPYLGLGAGAHAFRDGRRWWNLKPPTQYLETVEAGRLPVGGEETLNEEDLSLERLLLGLRVRAGVPAGWVPEPVARTFADQGLAVLRDGRFALTDRGMLLANEIVLAATS